MPENLSKFLFAAFCVLLVGAFFASLVAVARVIDPANYGPIVPLALIPTFFFSMVVWGEPRRIRTEACGLTGLWSNYPGFAAAVGDICLDTVFWLLLVPTATAIGAVLTAAWLGSHTLLVAVLFGWLVVPACCAFIEWAMALPARGARTTDPNFIRGSVLLTLEQAQRRALGLFKRRNELAMCWGGLRLPERYSSGHFVILGATGSGKTVTLRLLMQSILTRIGREPRGWRALIYDPKNEFWPLLSGMPLACPIHTLNPYDARSSAWAIARDIDHPSVARTLAATFIPDPGDRNSFFYKAAQNVIGAVMRLLLLYAPGVWTLRDVILAMSDDGALTRLLRSNRETNNIYRKVFLGDPRVVANIMITLDTEIEALRPIAGLWSHAKSQVSLRDWARGEYILLIGKDKELGTPLDNINRVLFQRISQILTKQGTGRSWLFIDEARFAGKITGLDDLLTTGRTFGVRVCLATQDLAGLRAVYGPDMAEEILGGAANKAMFATRSSVTASYVAGIMGKAERLEQTQSESRGQTRSITISEQIVQRETVMPEQVMSLYPAEHNSIYGYYSTPPVGNYAGWIRQAGLLWPAGRQPRIAPRDSAHENLEPWGDDDWDRLGPALTAILRDPEAEPGPPGPRRRTHLDDVATGGG